MKRYFKRYLDPCRRHPLLLVSSREIAATARRAFALRDPLIVKALREVARRANPDPTEPAHVGGDAQARATLNAAYLAALYAAYGDARRSSVYARRAKKGLVAYANMGVPIHSPGFGWLTHLYLVTLAPAYDLVWDLACWSAAERDALSRMFYTDIDGLLEAMHDKHMSNHAAWPMCRVATTAALFGDEPLLRECLDGPDSYCARLAHEFFDDGMSYEQSSTVYQDFSVEPCIITALAARGAGASPDPLTLSVANNFSLAFRGGSTGDFDMPFYPAGECEFPRPKAKNLRLALTAQFAMLRPDTTCPAIGDYGGPTRPSSDSWMTELAWDLYRDRRAARLLSMGARTAWESHIFDPHFLTLVFGRGLPKKTAFPSKSVIYPQAGYAVLKSDETDRYWGSKAASAVLKFGPYGNGHGHADKLHLDVAGGGGKCCIEELESGAVQWRYWNSTVSHNTVVIDGKSQPGDEGMFALNDYCGRLVMRDFRRRYKVASAEANDTYDRTRIYRRTVALADAYLVDIFEVETGKPAVFDWFLHGKGSLSLVGVVPAKGGLGFRTRGYQYFRNVRAGTAQGAFGASFSCGHSVLFPAAGFPQVLSVTGPWKKRAGRPALIVRRRGTRALFVAVHDPSGGAVKEVCADILDDSGIILSVEGRGYIDRWEFETPGLGARRSAGKRAKPSVRYLRSRVPRP